MTETGPGGGSTAPPPPPPPGQPEEPQDGSRPRWTRWTWPIAVVVAFVVGGGSGFGLGVMLTGDYSDTEEYATAQRELAEREAELDDRSARLDSAADELDEFRTKVDTLDQRTADVEERENELAERSDELDARADELDQLQEDLDQRSDELDEREEDLATTEVEIEENTIPGDGVFLVGEDIQPGQYRRSASGDGCYWVRRSGTSGDSDEIIANGLPNGPAVVTIQESDVAFETARCSEWVRIE